MACEYGEVLTFLVSIDVERTLQERDPAGVREEVRFLIDTFDRPEGGCASPADRAAVGGNGIVGGTPFENIAAFLDESVRYGIEHRRRFEE
jgi:hypothetical protein